MTEHWSARYLGLPWTISTDCGWLVEKVRAEVFGQLIALTPQRRPGAFGRNQQIRAEVSARAVHTDQPADGDIVLLICRARAQHVGLYCLIDGEPWVLHNGQGLGVTRMRVRELARHGYGVEGYYRWT